MDGLTERQFAILGDLVTRVAGIKLPAVKRVMVESRLRRRVRALGLPDLQTYATQFIEGGVPEGELVHLIDCVTTNKTDFFREAMHFDLLRNDIIPEIASGLRGRPLKVWSAACSTGAEPYTIAMVLAEAALARPLNFSVLATDISTEVLEAGRRAVYAAEMTQPVPPDLQRRYVMTSRDPAVKRVRIVPELRETVHFKRLNLMDDRYDVDRDMDVIFCRNVLIYFDQPTQRKVISKLARHLRPGGYLIVGHSESMAVDLDDVISQVKPTVYRVAHKKAAA